MNRLVVYSYFQPHQKKEPPGNLYIHWLWKSTGGIAPCRGVQRFSQKVHQLYYQPPLGEVAANLPHEYSIWDQIECLMLFGRRILWKLEINSRPWMGSGARLNRRVQVTRGPRLGIISISSQNTVFSLFYQPCFFQMVGCTSLIFSIVFLSQSNWKVGQGSIGRCEWQDIPN